MEEKETLLSYDFYNDLWRGKIKINGITAEIEIMEYSIGLPLFNDTYWSPNSYFFVSAYCYRKRKDKMRNMDYHTTFRENGMKHLLFFKDCLAEFQELMRERGYEGALVVAWEDGRRRNAYTKYLTKKMGFWMTHMTYGINEDGTLCHNRALVWKPNKQLNWRRKNGIVL